MLNLLYNRRKTNYLIKLIFFIMTRFEMTCQTFIRYLFELDQGLSKQYTWDERIPIFICLLFLQLYSPFDLEELLYF